MNTAAPTRPRFRVGSIPDELKQLDRWINFSVETNKNGRSSKVPFTPYTNQKARSNDPSTWRSFGTALEAASRDDLYLGFAFTPELDLTFLDFDGVLGAGGAVKAYAQLVIDQLDSYTEASVSGQGVHVVVGGRPPDGFTKEQIGGKVEVYPAAGGRFMLVTGDTRPGLGSLDGRIEDRTPELATFFPARPKQEAPPRAQNGASTGQLDENELAVIVDALRPYRTPGQMHDVDMAIGGILAKNGIDLEQARFVVGQLSDNEPKALTAVNDSYARAARGIDVRGYQALRELIPGDALAIVDGTLSRFWQARQATLVAPGRTRTLLAGSDQDAASSVDRFPAPPPEVYHGWFGGYLELVSETTEAPDQFHLASALTIIGAYAGRKVYTRIASGPVYPNLYTVLVGLSSESKKDTAMKRAWDMVLDPPGSRERSWPPYTERNSVASAESFIGGLKNTPNVILRMSEFSEVLANARRKGTTTILTMLMKAWDNPPQLSNDSISSPALAIDPYVSILAGTQPDVLAGDIVGSDITSGFANRILFVPGTGKGPNPWPPEVDQLKLHEHWKKARANLGAYSMGDYLPVNRTPRVMELWEAFYLTPRGETAIERTMAQRHQNMVLKVALIYAMTDCSKTIEEEHLRRAIAFVDWMWACVRPMLGDWAALVGNRLAKRITDTLTRTGPIKRRTLQAKTADPKWTPEDFARAIRALMDNQSIGVDEEGLIGLRND